MFSSASIDKVRELPIEEVIMKYVPDLKKSGSAYKASSPFSDSDKTPSFHVHPGKNIWKCFSTGNGGQSAVKFVQILKNLSWIEAVKDIANTFSITLEFDEERGAETAERYQRMQKISEVNQQALDYWIANLPNAPKEQLERISEAQRERFSIGYASGSFDELKKHLLEKGVSLTDQDRAGLVKKSETKDSFYDTFRDRLIFPIYTEHGHLIGFSGRDTSKKTEGKTPTAKYLNTRSTEAYSKSTALLGIHLAKIKAAALRYMIKVEGNVDATSFHEAGFENTVATNGTAITQDQFNLIKRYADTVVLCVDNDPAGRKKIERDTKLALLCGLKVEIFIPGEKGQDPDDYIKAHPDWTHEEFQEDFLKRKESAIEFLADEFFKDVSTTVERHAAQARLIELLVQIADGPLRNMYVKDFAKLYQIERKDVEESIKTELVTRKEEAQKAEGDTKFKLPAHIGAEGQADFDEYEFFADKRADRLGYYFPATNFGFERLSNFIIVPLFHIKALEHSERIGLLIHAKAGVQKEILFKLPNVALGSQAELEKVVRNLGGFWLEGSLKHFQKLKRKWLAGFPMVQEIRTLGWQRDGFWAFANGIVSEGVFKSADSHGIVFHGEEKFFLPAFSDIFKNLQEEDDVYENDRKLLYKPGADFAEWSKLFAEVYKDQHNGWFTIAWIVAVIFRDVVFAANNNFPLLFNFGMIRTGKSTAGYSASRVFKADSSVFNLNQGTQQGFNRRLARARNVAEVFDEYTNEIDEKKFQGLKGSFDGHGHERAVLSRDNRTETTKVNAGAIVISQYIPTRDTGSLFTRSILRQYRKTADKFTIDEMALFQDLKKMEAQGLSKVIVDVVKYRDFIEENFQSYQFEVTGKLKDRLREEQHDGRVASNYGVLITIVSMLHDKLQFPFLLEDFFNEAVDAIAQQSQQISEADPLAEFFKTFIFLIADYKIHEGKDFVVREVPHLNIRLGRGKNEKIVFDKSKQVLHLNLTKIYPLYLEKTRQQTGEKGLSDSVLISYMKDHWAYIGPAPKVKFDGHDTSAYCFDLEALGIDIPSMKRSIEIDPEIPTDTVSNASEVDMPF